MSRQYHRIHAIFILLLTVVVTIDSFKLPGLKHHVYESTLISNRLLDIYDKKVTEVNNTYTNFLRNIGDIHDKKFKVATFLASLVLPLVISSTASYADTSFPYNSYGSSIQVKSVTSQSQSQSQSQSSPTSSMDMLEALTDRFNRLRSGVTGEKVNEIRVGGTLVRRLRAIEQELDQMQEDIFSETIDWEVVAVYPKLLRTYSGLFTIYTDRAYPTASQVDNLLRYALRYEVGGFYTGVKDFEDAVEKKSQKQLQRAFARMSLAYDRYYKAGDLFREYDGVIDPRSQQQSENYFNSAYGTLSTINAKLNYIAPSIEAPALQDEVVMTKGPDKGRRGVVLWIAKGDNVEVSNVVVKLDAGESGHREVKLYPYSFVAKTTPIDVQFFDDLLAAYIASAISCGIMYPIDTYKTRMQIGKSGLPGKSEGGFFGLWKGVQYFVADANDAVYVASYGLIKPAFLAPIDPSNGVLVFVALVLSGSFGDALGSIFRVPMEIVYKRVQAGMTENGLKVLLSLGKQVPIRSVIIAWAAILLRDMPFAGLQIALYDIYKNIFAFLDELGWSSFAQSALWGVLAGGTAAAITTPFDVLTTNLLTAIEEFNSIPATTETNPMIPIFSKNGINMKEALRDARVFICDTGSLFQKSFNDVMTTEGIPGLFNGAVERVLFFGPAAMIFFTTYETVFNIISVARERHGLWF